jgi:hypothetical protein
VQELRTRIGLWVEARKALAWTKNDDDMLTGRAASDAHAAQLLREVHKHLEEGPCKS